MNSEFPWGQNSEHFAGEVRQPRAFAARQHDVAAVRPALELVHGKGQARRLVLTPGTYELRCVGQQGSSSTVTVIVCSPDAY